MADKQPRKSLTVRGRFWARHLQRWNQSGLSQAQYCRQQQLSVPAFGWWKRRLTSSTKGGPPAVSRSKTGGKDGGFVELAVAGKDTGPTVEEVVYEIALADHRQLRLGRHFELERVRQLLDLLEKSC